MRADRRAAPDQGSRSHWTGRWQYTALGLRSGAVVATAGTTDFGSIDPLPEIADLARAYDTWLHVDAAYGGGLLSIRHRLAGIDRADSVTVDYHKTFFQPVSSSALIVRDRALMAPVTWHADYLNPSSADKGLASPNQVEAEDLQTTHRLDALKLWLTLRMMGPDTIGEYVDAVVNWPGTSSSPSATSPTSSFRGATGAEHAGVPLRPCRVGTRGARDRRTQQRHPCRPLRVGPGDGRRHEGQRPPSSSSRALLNPLATVGDIVGVIDLVRETGAELVAAWWSSLSRPSWRWPGDPLRTDRVHDFVAIGLGPFNLGLACLTDPLRESDGVSGVFLEGRDRFDWHPGMLLDDATLQVPFLADLVTMADPRRAGRSSTTSSAQGNLYPFYIRESFYPLRRRYDDYSRWAAERLDSVRFGQRVVSVEHDGEACLQTTTSAGETWLSKRLVLGIGTSPRIPAPLRPLVEEVAERPSRDQGRVIHSSDYLAHKARLQQLRTITIVGSGESAGEVYYDLLVDAPGTGTSWCGSRGVPGSSRWSTPSSPSR